MPVNGADEWKSLHGRTGHGEENHVLPSTDLGDGHSLPRLTPFFSIPVLCIAVRWTNGTESLF